MKNGFKAKFLIFIATLMIVYCIPTIGFAATSVKVTLPEFQVVLNGQTIENSMRKYPLIVYKEITYFPMTYDDSRFLGLQSNWTKESGLVISAYSDNAPYKTNILNVKNNSTYNAVIVEDKITVNNKTITNKTEPYPLLNFREVTYFPLTWRFANDEFLWNYSFAEKTGLKIDKSGNTNGGTSQENNTGTVTTQPAVEAATTYGQTADGKVLTVVTIPKITSSYGQALKGVADISGSYVYYQGQGGVIYQAPVASPKTAKAVYTLPVNNYSSEYDEAAIKEENGKLILSYNTGGATMGSDVQVWLKPNGSNENIEIFTKGYTEYFDSVKIGVNYFSPQSKGNLNIKPNDAINPTPIGSPDLYYLLGTETPCIELSGDYVYTLANTATDGTNFVYRVNMKNNETVKVSDISAKYFRLFDKYIYLINKENKLQRIDLNGSNAQTLSIAGGTPSNLDVQNGYIIYSLNDSSGNYLETNVLSPSGKLSLDTKDKVLGINIDSGGNIQYVKN